MPSGPRKLDPRPQANRRANRRARASAFRWVDVVIAGAIVSAFGFAATRAPIPDAATAKVFNVHLGMPNIRQTAEQAKEDVVVRLGAGHEDAPGKQLGGATPEAAEIREKTCAADLVVVALPESEYRSAFSEDGSSIFSVRRFQVDRTLRKSTAVPDVIPSQILVAALGGTVTVNGHSVSIQRPSVADFRPGEVYLLFLRAVPGSGTFESPARSAYEISQGSALSIVNAKPLGLTPDDALEEIGKAATLCPSGPGLGALER
jgi:hypothetical protein